jgi:hypothetical protein
MSRLPVCSGADAVKAFRKLGYEVDIRPAATSSCKGTLRALVREAGLSKENFAELL